MKSIKSKYLPIIAIIISAISLFLSLILWFKDVDTNMSSTIIAALTLLSTTLIGWQIFQLLDLRKIEERFNNVESNLEIELDRIKGFSELSSAHAHLGFLTENPIEFYIRDYIEFSIDSLGHFSNSNETKLCEKIIDELIENIKKVPMLKDYVVKNHKTLLADLTKLNITANPEKYQNLIDLITK